MVKPGEQNHPHGSPICLVHRIHLSTDRASVTWQDLVCVCVCVSGQGRTHQVTPERNKVDKVDKESCSFIELKEVTRYHNRKGKKAGKL